MTKPKFQEKYRIESTRLPNHDYTANGWYFVTICTKNCLPYFGQVISSQVKLSEIGEIAQKCWIEIPNHFEHIQIDTYVIMPNHVHGIVIIDKPLSQNVETLPFPDNHVETLQCNVSTECDITQRQFMSKISPKSGSLSAIARSYKSAITRWCRQNNHDNFAWQPRFYEHIIRADGSLDRIREYIINNPAKWEEENNNSANLWM
jgi:putative transposase